MKLKLRCQWPLRAGGTCRYARVWDYVRRTVHPETRVPTIQTRGVCRLHAKIALEHGWGRVIP